MADIRRIWVGTALLGVEAAIFLVTAFTRWEACPTLPSPHPVWGSGSAAAPLREVYARSGLQVGYGVVLLVAAIALALVAVVADLVIVRAASTRQTPKGTRPVVRRRRHRGRFCCGRLGRAG